MRSTRILRHLSVLLVLSLGNLMVSGCGSEVDRAGNDSTTLSGVGSGDTPASSDPTTQAQTGIPSASNAESPASSLNRTLNNFLQEHVALAAASALGVLQRNDAENRAARASLAANSADLAAVIALAYGVNIRDSFRALWSDRVDALMTYADALVAEDAPAADAAANALSELATNLSILFENMTEGGLEASAIEVELLLHDATMTTILDSLADGELNDGFLQLREAMAQMRLLATPLTEAIAAQLPTRYPGNAASPRATLRRDLNLLLQESVLLAGGAISGRLKWIDEEFSAAAAALDENSSDLESLLASAYGTEAGSTFRTLWDAYIEELFAYTDALATDDTLRADEAFDALVDFTDEFAAYLAGLSNALAREAMQPLLLEHAETMKEIVDELADWDLSGGYTALRAAAAHMSTLALPLAEAIFADSE